MTIAKKSFSELSGELAAISAAHAASHPGFAEATARAQAAKVARDRAEEAYAKCPTPAAAEVRAAAFGAYEACLCAARTAYKSVAKVAMAKRPNYSFEADGFAAAQFKR